MSTSILENTPSIRPDLLKGLKLTGHEDPSVATLLKAEHLFKNTQMSNLRPLLPLLFTLKGDPYTLQGHEVFESFFRTRIPRKTVYCTGRQVGKSLQLAARKITQSLIQPYYNTLFITPQYEMARRLSQNYIRPLLEESPVKQLMVSTKMSHSVLQRTFLNKSQMQFSFAFLSPDRVRGVSTDELIVDESQDLDSSFLPILAECLSGSRYGGIQCFSGTPKSLENTMNVLWQDSSQAEWAIQCVRCGKWNIPALSHDLDGMIGPWHEDIGPDNPGIICVRCRKPKSLFPQTGRWLHAYKERRWDFVGRHIPQIIMPMHCCDPEKWALLLDKRSGRNNTPINVFYNEVCGESYDTGSRIVTLTELKAASTLPWKNDADIIVNDVLDRYVYRVLAVDWGGGGEKGMSYTCLAALGFCPDGKIECFWGLRSLTPHDPEREARICLQAITKFRCHVFAHDYTGAGAKQETFIIQAGYPFDRIVNVSYYRAASSARIMSVKPPTKLRPRGYYLVDKTRSLLLTCNQIKNGWLKFFAWDYENKDNPGLIYDFLGLVDEKADSKLGTDIYTIIRDPTMRDDFAQAVNIGCCTLWNMTDRWPNIAAIAGLRLDPNLMAAIQPVDQDVLEEW